MSLLFYILGPGGSGKDSVYAKLCEVFKDILATITLYTDRPMRPGEQDGVEYNFRDMDIIKKFEREGKLIEKRTYQTTKGEWCYATIDDGNITFDKNYIAIGTLESLSDMRKFFKPENVIPIYISLKPEVRMQRVINREIQSNKHDYDEMCRRWLTDSKDFNQEKIDEANVNIIYNNDSLDSTVIQAIKLIISKIQS